ncbi:hypothetical protein ACFXTO_018816 [Malus domestica]
MVVDVHMGNNLACLSKPSFVECLEKVLILFLEDLIRYCYLVVLSLQLLDFSLKNEPLSLLRTKCDRGVVLCAVASFVPYVEEGCLVKESVRIVETSLTKLKRVGISAIPTDGAKR